MITRLLAGDTAPRIGFGTWGIGGGSYGHVDDAESLRALALAFDRGVTFYDSANIYGDGHSEELLGKAFAGKRDEVLLATKAGYVSYTDRSQSFEPGFIRASLEASLKRLRTDYVDILFLHSPPRETVGFEGASELLCCLQDEGKIRWKGVSARSSDDALLAIRTFDYDCLQVFQSLLVQDAYFNGLLAEATRRSIPIIAKSPLCYGLLTGKYRLGQFFPMNDHRSRLDQSQKDAWIRQSQAFGFLFGNGAGTAAQAALQFVMTHPGVIPIPGMKNRVQVQENLDSLALPGLNSDDIGRCRQIYLAHDKN